MPKVSDILRSKLGISAPSGSSTLSHPNVSLIPFSQEHLSPFKRINSLLLPIPYNKSFYDEIISDPVTASISVAAVWRDDLTTLAAGKVIGGIRCRILTPSSTGIEKGIATSFPSYTPGSGHRTRPDAGSTADGEKILYISSLTLLSPYRGHGVANALLESVERVAMEKYGIAVTGAHVWVANEEGLEWYRKRGFKEVRREDEYYRRLDPMGALVIRREITATNG
ncbi:Pre-mRNA-splicing factor cwf24-like protein [Elsinoe fawcettii]|nr:Pre-mRNA-splicing factor cwf24-like protein [Elsinoe fawcettii]